MRWHTIEDGSSGCAARCAESLRLSRTDPPFSSGLRPTIWGAAPERGESCAGKSETCRTSNGRAAPC
jgi:hypothetical protein